MYLRKGFMLAASLLSGTRTFIFAHAKPIAIPDAHLQVPLDHPDFAHLQDEPPRRLHGRFLHITGT